MDLETQQQVDALSALRGTHERRLNLLQIQAASMGMATPPEIRMEIQDIDSQLLGIDQTIRRLYIQESRFLARILPPNNGEEYTSGDEVKDRLDAIGRYVIDIETAIHREMGALQCLLDSNNMTVEAQLSKRRKRTLISDVIIVILLLTIIIVLLLK